MMETTIFGRKLSVSSEKTLLWAAFRYYFPRYLYSRIFTRPKRTPQSVEANYECERRDYYYRFEKERFGLEEYIFGPSHEKDFVLLDDKIVYCPTSLAKQSILRIVESYLEPYLAANKGTIIEFGSGSGRNLLYLKKKYPQIDFVGLELSPQSVSLSKAASERFGIDVQFIRSNICELLPPLPENVAVSFSCHALEQIPRLFPMAVKNMYNTASQCVLLFEPVVELYPNDLRGIIEYLRAAHMDRLTGLISHLEKEQYNINEAKRLENAVNPLNETCVIRITKSSAGDSL